MIAILAVLLHNGAIEAADLLCTPVDHQTESCTLTQAPTTRQAVQNYYQHSSSTASCLEHVDNMQVPSNKSSMLRAGIIRMHKCYVHRVMTAYPTCTILLYPIYITTYSG